MLNVTRALAMVSDGMTLGLGSGQAAEAFVFALSDRIRAGLKIRGVATSSGTAAIAERLGVPLVELADALPIDMTFDGADEVDPALNLLKGFGHALIREKVVAAASKKLVILIGPRKVEEKLVPALGSRGELPIEVVPFALPLVLRRVNKLGLPGTLVRDDAGEPRRSDNGNLLVHLAVQAITDPAALDGQLRGIPGIVGTGLFCGLADVVLIDHGGRLEERHRG
ncbi:MAG: ribose 5-phosphate isomerase A [Gemmataceae bacterium]